MLLSGVHRTQISKYERGETEPQAEVLARLSRALGVSADEFFAGVGWQEDPPRLIVELDPVEATMNQIPSSPQRAGSATATADSEPIRDFLLRVLNHDAVADEVVEIQLAYVLGGRSDQAEIAAAVRLKIQEVLHAATGEDWAVIAEAYIASGDRLDRKALAESGAGRVHQYDRGRIAVGLVRDFLAVVVTDPVAADHLAEVRNAGPSYTTAGNAEAVRQAVTGILFSWASEDDWNEIAGRLVADALEMEAEGRLSFYDLHRQRYAEGNPIAEAAEFTIGDFPSAGGGVGPSGEFKIKLIELVDGGRWSLYPHLEVFGDGTDALRRAIAAGLLEALGPVASRDDFGRRLIALGFVDRSDAPIAQSARAVTA
jgi:transcriptional regulator with XRE-family HTH domain